MLFWIFLFPWALARYWHQRGLREGAKDEREQLIKALQATEKDMRQRGASRFAIKIMRYTISIVQRRHNLIAADEGNQDTIDVLVGEAKKDDIARTFGGKK